MEDEYIYIGILFGLLAICLLVLRCKSRKKRRATVNSIHEREHVCHETREYTIYTIPQIGTPLQSQYQPVEPRRNYDDDLPPKYEDLVVQQPSTTPEDTAKYPPRYNF